VAAAARGWRSALAALAGAALVVAGGGIGCTKGSGDASRDPAPAPHDEAAAPRYAAERADVAVVMSGARSDFDWFNAAVQTFGAARALALDATPASLANHRVLIVPANAVPDARLASTCRTALDSGAVALVDIGAALDERAVARWRELAAAVPGRVIALERGRDRGGRAGAADLLALLEPAAAPMPRLLTHPAGFAGVTLLTVAGTSRALGALAPELAPVHAPSVGRGKVSICFSACITDTNVDASDLEALRKIDTEIGVVLPRDEDAGLLSQEARLAEAQPISEESWKRFEATREAMRRAGAEDADLAFAFTPATLTPSDYTRLADSGVTLLTIPLETAEGALPFQPADERGLPLPLVVVPSTDATGLAGDPSRFAGELARATRDSLWTTRVERYSGFWKARARSALTSEWDGSRLRVDVDAIIDMLVVAVPRSAGGKSLREVLKDGKSVPLPAGAQAVEIPLARGPNTIWAIYS
jgi:hypothetical protein